MRERIEDKPSLIRLYSEFYLRFARCLNLCPGEGLVVEVGSGAGFLKKVVPLTISTDILPYETVDLAMDATRLPFADNSLRGVFLLNTLHHIAQSELFFQEISRCLTPGGRVLIFDQYHGFFSKYIYKYLHHEPYDAETEEWKFASSGPLSGANGALAWIIFCRDKQLFTQKYPHLHIEMVKPHTPLRYWLCGGLKRWCLLPSFLFPVATAFDRLLSKLFPQISSFVEVELCKTSS